MRDINKVLEEIEWLVKTYRLDSICINDDNFSVDIDRTHYFCRQLIERKIISGGWKCSSMEIWRVDDMDLDLLERSGCKRILMGLEAGSEKMLGFLNRTDTMDVIKRVVNKFGKSKVIAHYDLIIGYPNEGPKEISETLDLIDYIRKVDPKAYFSHFHMYTPFPNTELFQIAVEKYGLVPPKRLADWHNFRLEVISVPWIKPEMRNSYLNLCLISFFIADHRFGQKVKINLASKIFVKIYSAFAKYYWKRRKFNFCPEFGLLYWLINYKIRRKINQIKKKGILDN